jgi:hypothetical protein
VSISIEELTKHGGPPMGLSFPHPSGWSGGRFDHDYFAYRSSPPGGPEMLAVWSHEAKTHDFTALDGLVAKKYPKLARGGADKLTIAGTSRVAMTRTRGKGHASSATCVAMIPGPTGTSAGLIVELTTGWQENKKATCAGITQHEVLAKLVNDIRIDISGSD